ncbi:MAG: DUF429 domain-containing protein [Myxococcales bacterium]|nr:DUF429 domain-containing protein [Myxococcales bacterium]
MNIPSGKVRSTLEAEASGDSVLVAWDAPLSFDPVFGFSDRPIDRAIRRFVREHPLVEPKAVAALPFSGCPHWAITCSTLGTPFSSGERGWKLAPTILPATLGRFVFEVNPSVAWAFWWIAAGIGVPMPRYKGQDSKRGRDALVANLTSLSIPPEAAKTDDTLDAWAAWRLLRDFIEGRAEMVGDPRQGAYLLPKLPTSRVRLVDLLNEARAELKKNAGAD